VSRGIRWDSDHIVIMNDEVTSLAEEIIRADALKRVHVALDFFDGSVNRLGAWVIGTRSTLKAFLRALLEPRAKLLQLEQSGDLFGRLAVLEEAKTLPLGAVWDYYCKTAGVPVGESWIQAAREYERRVLAPRG
jgi:L-rhamnose isomerase